MITYFKADKTGLYFLGNMQTETPLFSQHNKIGLLNTFTYQCRYRSRWF